MRRYVALLVAACCIIAMLYANSLNLFIVAASSNDQAMKYLIVKGIEMQRDVPDPIICSDNIKQFNLTGYTLISYDEIQKKADLEGDTPYIGVGVPRISGDDICLDVIRNMAVPSAREEGYLAASGAEYHFHRYFWRIWGYSIEYIVQS